MDPETWDKPQSESEQGVADETRAASEPEPAAPQEQDEGQVSGYSSGRDRLDCQVVDPHRESEGSKDSYISYLVRTETSLPIFQKTVFAVRRRFTDFVFLANTLARDYQAIAIPPLPAKHKMQYITGDRFGAEFTSKRRESLDRFLKRLTLHPILRRSPHLAMFLESSDWNSYTRTAHLRSASTSMSPGPDSGRNIAGSASGVSTSGSGVFEGFGDALLNAFSKISKPDPKFIEYRESAEKLEHGLHALEKLITKIVRRETDLEGDYHDFAGLLDKLAVIEQPLEQAVYDFQRAIRETGNCIHQLRERTDVEYLTSLRDLDMYVGSLKALLKVRDQKQLDHEALSDYLTRSNHERETLSRPGGGSHSAGGYLRSKVEDLRGVDHEQSRIERVRKVELRIDELVQETERAKVQLEGFDNEVTKEYDIFQETKASEMKQSLSAFAGSQVDFYRQLIQHWQQITDQSKSPSPAVFPNQP